MTDAHTPPTSIRQIGVVGAGQMGAAAAAMFSRAGFCVRLWARDAGRLQAARNAVDAVGSFLAEQMRQPAVTGGELIFESDLAAVDATSDAVLECVAEDMGQKQELLRTLPFQVKVRVCA